MQHFFFLLTAWEGGRPSHCSKTCLLANSQTTVLLMTAAIFVGRFSDALKNSYSNCLLYKYALR